MGLTYPNFITNDLVRCDAKFIPGNLAEVIELLPCWNTSDTERLLRGFLLSIHVNI
jgi:hypothetical protein